MGIEKMSQLTVEGTLDKLDDALMLCCESRMFQISDVSGGTLLRSTNEQNPYEGAYTELRDTAQALNITPEFVDYSNISYESAEDFKAYHTELSQQLSELRTAYEDMQTALEEHMQTDSYVKHMLHMDVSFTELFNMRYIKSRFGKMPAENLAKLEYYDKKCLHFMTFEEKDGYAWGLYLTPNKSSEFADMVMNSLCFERTRLPDYLIHDPDSTDEVLQQIITNEKNIVADLEKKISSFADTHRSELLSVMSKLKYLYDCFELRKKALISDGRFSFSGYCPTRNSTQLTDKLTAIESVTTTQIPIKGRMASADVPVKLKNNFIFRPFEMFVKMYGLPEYGTFDPTPYVAVTYMLMFGIMFGDVGQGLAISLLGLVMSRFSKNGLFPIMTRIGLFSAAFGVLYGSVFGIETIIEPFFHRENVWKLLGYTEQPHNIFQVATVLLIAALGIGIVLITISMTFNTVLNFRKRKWGEALFSVNGVCGLTFYISLVAGVACMFMLDINLFSPVYIICLIVLPLVLIFFKHPLSDLISGIKHEEKMSVGNFIIENFIDLFEAALSFLSNTMSFLRIGGFILSHAGMMLVVAQLAGTNVPDAEITVGTVITYIIGNLIVMGVEGLLVGIQILRLEFYEIFNRFYSGNGQSFRPVQITFETEN